MKRKLAQLGNNYAALRPKLMNVTRWSSAYEMVKRYLKVKRIFKEQDFPDEFKNLRLTRTEEEDLEIVFDGKMKALEAVTKKLQTDSFRLCDARTLFDELLEEYPDIEAFKKYLSREANIIHSMHFENAVVKIQRGKERLLSADEKDAVRMFKVTTGATGDRNSTTSTDDFAERALKRQKIEDEKDSSKRVNFTENSKYVDLIHVGATSCIVERLFSKAGLILTDTRRSILPKNFEAALMLHINRDMWNLNTVIDAFNRRNKTNRDGNNRDDENSDDDNDLDYYPPLYETDSDSEDDEIPYDYDDDN